MRQSPLDSLYASESVGFDICVRAGISGIRWGWVIKVEKGGWMELFLVHD